ncbi:hypothetical protein EPUS_06853 [Endocarpon pusillum Z07020]|uniref:Uncharacterized protein n=1 Tax=Endocarpon pusillum (strain Z07020 / HMAS-L-300199) TaxID=1263415 RepID=U1I160_ENDPU|nr:uncharacterized protein EPUS_06853 [Endocarpon pusillum Z07020]ERF76985.1 hypothetical protein EPUS_06853 [Endocarpon pusillum Z07020]
MNATSMCLCRLVQTITRNQNLNTRGQMCEALEAHAGWLNDNVNVSDGAIFLVGLAGALSDRTDIEGPRHALDVIKNLERLPSDAQDDETTTYWGCNRQTSDSQNGIDFSNSPRLDTDIISHDDFDGKHSVLGFLELPNTVGAGETTHTGILVNTMSSQEQQAAQMCNKSSTKASSSAKMASTTTEDSGFQKRPLGRKDIWDLVEELCQRLDKNDPLRREAEEEIRLKRTTKRQKNARQNRKRRAGARKGIQDSETVMNNTAL